MAGILWIGFDEGVGDGLSHRNGIFNAEPSVWIVFVMVVTAACVVEFEDVGNGFA